MSSRRKSRPVRRLDMICSQLKNGEGEVPVPSWLASGAEGEAQPEMDEEGDDVSGSLSPEVTESLPGDTNPSDQPESTEQDEPMKTHHPKSRPPEGVYILQPEGVSDDEERKALRRQEETPKTVEVRKRSHERSTYDDDHSSEMQNQSEEPGLDLSVKRPRIDEERGPYPDFTKPSSAPHSKSTSPNIFSGNTEETTADMNEQLEKYHQLMRLVSQQKTLPQAMEEVGMTAQDFFSLHRLNNQLSLLSQGKPSYGDDKVSSAPPSVSTMFEKFSNKDMPTMTMQNTDAWTSEKESHDAKIQALLREANEDVLQQQKEAQQLSSGGLMHLPMGLHPSMSAALMASLSNGQDQNGQERQEFLRNLFMKAQGYYSPAAKTPNKNNDSYMSLSKTPSSSSKNDSITAGTVSSGVGSIKKGTLDPANFDEDVFDQYIAKFTNMNRCGSLTCPYFTRDHYHCVVEDCNYQRFTNKADVIRHYNMHKKRDNSLAHGFLRFSPTEDCSSKYPNCHLNGKSTHYHCMQPDCNKVYTSTSDVMTHENFHKKYMQFVCSGFKRFRATEKCDLESCIFRDQKTTHFHCTREDCNFTFKNKCDIEKHKTYHLRDDAYISKGFKKFYKNESCGSDQCVWNYTANHFHCLRSGCNFSFTSTSQMDSHKRKHDRNEFLGDTPDNLRDLQSSSSQNSPKLPVFSPALFQETARKILSSMTTTPSPSQQFLYKAITSQPDAGIRQPQSGSVSPTTPVATIRNFTPLNVGASPSLSSGVSVKEEPSWKPPPVYTESSLAQNLSSSANPPTTNADNAIESKVRSLLEVSQADWPRGSGVISPSMAISAAAALKPSSSQVVTISDTKPEVKIEEMEQDLEPRVSVKVAKDEEMDTLSKKDTAFKYFAIAEPYNCWIPQCDFASKQHFHCLVENCGAMFSTGDNVIKHAKFHQSLESMGAALPIQQPPDSKTSPSVEKRAPSQPENESAPTPPPGYIALQSGAPKPSDLTLYDSSKLRGGNTSPTEGKNDPQIKLQSPITPLNGLPIPRSQFPTFTAQLYASALLKGPSSSHSDVSVSQPLLSSTPSNTAYRYLQSQAALFNNLSHPSSTQLPGNSIISATDDSEGQHALLSNDKRETGFIHIKAGMPCLRPDCKYIQQNHWHCTMNRCRYVCKSLGKAQTHRQAHDSLEAYAKSAKQCFRSYSVKKKCPNVNCEFKLRGHYHCLKPGCQFATIGTSKLPWHMKKHEKIARREASGFKYFTKKEQCGHFECKYNGLFSHYHCIRTGCTFAFQYKHQMSTHVRKHLRRMLGRSYTGGIQDIDHTNVDSGDDSLPLIIDEVEEAEQRPGMGRNEEQKALEREPEQTLSRQQMEVLERMTKQMAAMAGGHRDVTGHEGIADQDAASAAMAGMDENDSNSDDNSSEDYGALDLSSLAAGSSKSNESGGQQQQNDIQSLNEDSMSNGMGNSSDDSEGNMDAENEDGNQPAQSPTTPAGRGPYLTKFKLNDEMPSGFKRFETNENCGEEKCPYVFKVSHYHCTRENCSYRFTGRTHMYKHQQHHDRVAGLVRDDFKRFRANNPCEDEQCEFKGKNTHFHCLRCDFKCTDSAKVGTHRRQHIKADTLEQSGFQRVRGKDDCGREECKYRFRNMSHFHCLQPNCHYTVVGLTGIELHAEKHRRGLLMTPATPNDNANLILQNFNAFRNMQQHMINAAMAEKLSHNGGEDVVPQNLSMAPMAALRQLSSAPHTPTSPPGSENGHLNQTSPFSITPNDPTQLLSKFAFLSSSTPAQEAMVTAASSPVNSNSVSMVTESVGS